ncbi:MAG: hypothetical protein FK731_12030 [Asgard group archaeon]|nr:hypothetical protein [Asgard group archaeon]
MLKIQIPRRWFLVIAGIADWHENAKTIPLGEFLEIKEIIDNYLSRVYRAFRKKGALVGSLLWSQENLAPMFLIEANRMNEQFLKEQRVIFDNLAEKILASLTHEERQSAIGANIQSLALEGKILLLECTLPQNNELYPTEEEIANIFSDAFNAEFLTIKRAEHDFEGRKDWLASIENVLSREFIEEVGPVKKLREAKEVEAKKLYDKKSPGDFEKIVRILSEAVPYRSSLFEVEKPSTSYDSKTILGHIIVHYLSTKGDFPTKLTKRSILFNRVGRKLENYHWVLDNNIEWKELDKIMIFTEQIAYDQIEKIISDVGGIKLDAFWTERDLSNNVFFLSQFSFTEDIMKQLKAFVSNPRKELEKHIGYGITPLYELWQKAGLHFNLLIFEVKAFDQDEERKLIEWVKLLKTGKLPGPSYSSEKETIEERHYRPF